MLFRRLSAALAIFVVASSAALGQTQAPVSVTGNWEGTLTFKKDGQTVDTDELYAVLKQEGAVVTGTAGPNAERQFPITKVKFATPKEGPTLSFEVTAGTLVIWFDLKLVDGVIKGTATGVRDGDKQTAEVELKRLK